MTNIKIFLFVALQLPSLLVLAQKDARLEDELAAVKRKLEVLSDTIAPGLNEYATLSVSNMPIQAFLRSLAESHRLNVQIDPSIQVSVTNNFTNVLVKDLIYFLCEENGMIIRFTNSIMSFYKYEAPAVVPPARLKKIPDIRYDKDNDLVSFDFYNDSLRSVTKAITQITNRNVLAVGAEAESKQIKVFIKDLPLESALEKMAYANGLRFNKTKDKVYILESEGGGGIASQTGISTAINKSPLLRSNQGSGVVVKDSLISVDVVNYPIIDIINQASEQLGKDYILFSEVTGNTSVNVKRINYHDLLNFLFQGTNFTYKVRNRVYLIGQRNLEGFRSSELVRLDFRTIDGIDKEIPTEMMKDVELKILKELNSIVLTGNRHKIEEIIAFVKLIDKPIPNILIEVIVVDARKGFSLQTGFQAFLSSDSAKATSGQVFPGANMTLSSQSINNALSSLSSKGIINLGRVAPSFYATLKALESNNNIKIRSTPKLSTINGSKANLLIGESKYYVEQTQNVTGGVTPVTTTSQRFNKVEANLSITISPLVSGNEHITLDISAEFSNFVPATIPNAPPGNTTRKFESKIRIRNEELIVLGGLEEVSTSNNGSGVPLLSRIPVIKWLFSTRSQTNSNNRLIIFIRPTLVY